MFDPKDRPRAFDLLSHPVFKKYNKVYISQQIALTRPVTEVERHALQKIRKQGKTNGAEKQSEGGGERAAEAASSQDIKLNHFLDIMKIKVHFEKKITFSQFLMQSFSQVNLRDNEAEFGSSFDQSSSKFKGFNKTILEQATEGSQLANRLIRESRLMKKKKIPQLVRVINKDERQFSAKFKYGSNLRLLREYNYTTDLYQVGRPNDLPQEQKQDNPISKFLILKSDLAHIRQLNHASEQLVVNDLKSIIQAPIKQRTMISTTASSSGREKQSLDQQSIISDGSSVYSSASAILDSISSIFSIRSAQSNQAKPPPKPDQESSKEETKSSRPEQMMPEPEDVDDKIQEYLMFQYFLKQNTAVSTDQSVLRKMIRRYSDILRICKSLRIKAFKRLFSKSQSFEGPIDRFINQHQEMLNYNEAIMVKSDLSQVKKDIERISLHPILKSEDVRSQLHQILCTFLATCNFPQTAEQANLKERVSYI